MTTLVAIVADSEADIRWRNWLARGVESDRRTRTRMRGLMLVTVIALAVWLFVRLA